MATSIEGETMQDATPEPILTPPLRSPDWISRLPQVESFEEWHANRSKENG